MPATPGYAVMLMQLIPCLFFQPLVAQGRARTARMARRHASCNMCGTSSFCWESLCSCYSRAQGF
eukprot:4605026-Amphidinium_carterae.2